MSVVDISTGKVITTVPIGAGVDAVVYDAAQIIFCSNGDGTTTIIRQESADGYKCDSNAGHKESRQNNGF